MANITIGIRDSDVELLGQVAEQQWRTPEQQASAFIEQVLASQRARANATPRSSTRRSNGVLRSGVHAVAATG
jgi:hypothetical protein